MTFSKSQKHRVSLVTTFGTYPTAFLSRAKLEKQKNLFVVARQKSNVEWNCISCECAILKQSRRRRLRFSLAVLQLESSFVCQRAKCQVAVRLHTHIRKHTRTLTHTTAAFCFGRVFVIACFYFWLFFFGLLCYCFCQFLAWAWCNLP